MVTLEKTFLEGTVDQLKSNHRDEVQAMVSLYEYVCAAHAFCYLI